MNKTKRLIRIVGSLIFSVVLLASIPGVRSYAFDKYEDQTLYEELRHQGYSYQIAIDEVWERKGQPDVYGTGGIDGVSTYGTCSFGGTNSSSSSGTSSSSKHTHIWSEPVTTKEPLCSEEGEAVETCSCGKTRTVKLPKLDHTYVKEDTSASCTKYRKETYTCSCGDTYTIEFPEEGYAEHIYIPTEDSYDASCTEPGKVYYVCNCCGDAYEEDIEPLGHSFTKYTIDNPPSCKTEGAKSIYCDECGEMQEGSTVVIEKTPHIEDSNHDIIPATFWKNGLEKVHCVDCSEVLSETILHAKGGVFRYVIPIVSCLLAILIVFTVLKKKK